MKIICTGRGAALTNVPVILSEVFQMAKTEKPVVVYLGTPSYDKQSIFDIQTKGFKEAGCEIIRLNLSEVPIGAEPPPYPSLDEIKLQMSAADVIQISGGNTMYAIQRWKALGVDILLKELAGKKENAPVLCGGSAGAICWFSEGVSDSLNPATLLNPDPNLTKEQLNDWDYIRISGLGLLKGLCVPHYDIIQHNGLFRASASEKFVKEIPNTTCIGIDEDAALVVNGDVVKVVQGASDKTCYRKIWNLETNTLEVLRMEKGISYTLSSLGLT